MSVKSEILNALLGSRNYIVTEFQELEDLPERVQDAMGAKKRSGVEIVEDLESADLFEVRKVGDLDKIVGYAAVVNHEEDGIEVIDVFGPRGGYHGEQRNLDPFGS
jgi:hypothetical protein